MIRSAKRFIRSSFDRLGYRITRDGVAIPASLDLLGLGIAWAHLHCDAPFVLQIGANDGVQHDQLRKWILKHKLPSLMVEPLPDVFERLKANYQDYPWVKTARCAIDSVDGPVTIYRVSADAPASEDAQLLASFSRELLLRAKDRVPGIENFIVAETVEALRIDTLLARYGVPHPTLVAIDAEGHDATIIHHMLDCNILPLVINFEIINLQDSEKRRVGDRLRGLGYGLQQYGGEAIACRNPSEIKS